MQKDAGALKAFFRARSIAHANQAEFFVRLEQHEKAFQLAG